MRKGSFKLRQKDVKELERVIRNFNQKRYRLIKKDEDFSNFLPSRKKISDIKKEITSRSDFNRILNEIKRFSNRGSETRVITDTGVFTTKYQLKEIKLKLNRINRERKKIRESGMFDKRKGNINQISELNLEEKKVNIDKVKLKDWDRFNENLERQLLTRYKEERSDLYQFNYMQSLYSVFGSKADEIQDIISKIPADVFIDLYYNNDIPYIEFLYNELELQLKFEYVRKEWLNISETLQL